MALDRHDVTEVLSLAERGKSSTEIAAELNIPRPLVDMLVGRIADASVTIPRPGTTEATPWSIAPEHQNDEDAQMLRLEHHRRMGEGLTQRELDDLTHWRTRLRETGGVVDYSPARGFHWTQRTASDRDIVRRPSGV